jgi:hypothetical protein
VSDGDTILLPIPSGRVTDAENRIPFFRIAL